MMDNPAFTLPYRRESTCRKDNQKLTFKCSQEYKIFGILRSVHRLLAAASVVPSSPILVTLMKKFLKNVGSYKSHTA
jgi:hypothetical protein